MLVKQNPMRKTENMVIRHLGHWNKFTCTPKHKCGDVPRNNQFQSPGRLSDRGVPKYIIRNNGTKLGKW